MGSVQLDEQYENIQEEKLSSITEEFKELSRHIAYFKKVMEQTENRVDKLDRNIIYEIVYCHERLKQLIEAEFTDKQLSKEANELEKQMSLLVDLIPSETIDKALTSQSISNTSKIDKAKYVTKISKSDSKYTYEKRAYVSNSPMMSWLDNNKLSIFAYFALIFIMLSGGYGGTITAINNAINLPKYLDAIVGATAALISFIMVILVTVKCISMSFDIAYITLPYIRQFMEHMWPQYISEDAKNALMIDLDGNNISYIKVREKDRIKRNLGLLEYMQSEYPNSNRLNKIAKILKENKRGKKYFYTIAQIEYIYDMVLAGKLEVLEIVDTENKSRWEVLGLEDV